MEQGTPLYAVLTWTDDSVADSVHQVVGWWPAPGPVWHPIAVEMFHNEPARVFWADLDKDTDPFLDYYPTYAEAAEVITRAEKDNKITDRHRRI